MALAMAAADTVATSVIDTGAAAVTPAVELIANPIAGAPL